MGLFFSDISRGIKIDYDQLVADINRSTSCPLYISSSDYYKIFKALVLSLVHDKDICLLDADFTEQEFESLLGNTDINDVEEVPNSMFSNFSEIIERIQNTTVWRLSLFTSGTTGLPKKISHSFKSLTRNCKISEHHRASVWAYAYNPTHMAGLQVFFQALLNENAMVRLFGLSRNDIFQSIKIYEISHLSATPTFLRLLLPADNSFESIKRITSGGEKFDTRLTEGIKVLFPNAKLLNVYASTEAGSIFAAEGEIFSIRKSYENLVKIEGEELFLHKEILGIGTEKKLIGDWYPTGDLVEVIEEKPLRFRFLSRKNEMINVGGYKVNPNEVEDALLGMNGILDARVFGKANSVLGNILCAELIKEKELEISEVRNYLTNYLQDFKIPRMIKFVDNIEKTRTGKKKR